MPDIYFHGVTEVEIINSGINIGSNWIDLIIHTPDGTSEISMFAKDKKVFDIFNRHLTTTDEEADQMEANT